MAPFTRLIKKDQPFPWGVKVENEFQSLKVFFTIASFLIQAYFSKPFVLETDTSDFAIGVILSQLGKNNLLHLVNYHSYKFFLIKINYKIHDKKNLAIVDTSFEVWHHLLEGAQHEIIVYSNHKTYNIS